MKTFKAIDDKSISCLEAAAEILGNDPDRRALLQEVYNLGVKDGQLMTIQNAIKRAINENA